MHYARREDFVATDNSFSFGEIDGQQFLSLLPNLFVSIRQPTRSRLHRRFRLPLRCPRSPLVRVALRHLPRRQLGLLPALERAVVVDNRTEGWVGLRHCRVCRRTARISAFASGRMLSSDPKSFKTRTPKSQVWCDAAGLPKHCRLHGPEKECADSARPRGRFDQRKCS
jgi:hypothetical protein